MDYSVLKFLILATSKLVVLARQTRIKGLFSDWNPADSQLIQHKIFLTDAMYIPYLEFPLSLEKTCGSKFSEHKEKEDYKQEPEANI